MESFKSRLLVLHRLRHLVVQTRSDVHNLYKFSVISRILCNYASYLYYIHPLETYSRRPTYALSNTPFMNCFDTDMPSSGSHYNKGT